MKFKFVFVFFLLVIVSCSSTKTAQKKTTDNPLPKDAIVFDGTGIRGGKLVLPLEGNPTSFYYRFHKFLSQKGYAPILKILILSMKYEIHIL